MNKLFGFGCFENFLKNYLWSISITKKFLLQKMVTHKNIKGQNIKQADKMNITIHVSGNWEAKPIRFQPLRNACLAKMKVDLKYVVHFSNQNPDAILHANSKLLGASWKEIYRNLIIQRASSPAIVLQNFGLQYFYV